MAIHRSNVRELTSFTKKEIKKTFDSAYRILKTEGITLLVAPSVQSFGKILIITPRKVGSAPVRNKIRRQIKSLFYEEKLYELGFDWIAIIRPAFANNSFDEIKKLFSTAQDNLSKHIADQNESKNS